MYKVLISTAGTGSRLDNLTKTTNKALITVHNKKIIDYILTSYDPAIPLVISLGYYGEGVKKYLQETYPTRDITFVFVDPFTGPGSSLGYSMLAAKEFLQGPFIFHCNDTIVLDNVPTPENSNWDGIAFSDNSGIFTTTQYSSVLIEKNFITEIQSKGATQHDGLHIGLVGIKDYDTFWSTLEKLYQQNSQDETLNDCAALDEMIKNNIQFIPHVFEHWFDTGNEASLSHTTENLKRFIK